MISFVRIDDRMIHGQTVTRWSIEYPCDGIIAVNDVAASNPVLKAAYKGAAPDKKIFVWTMDHFKESAEKVLASKTKYFLITKNPLDMKEILVDFMARVQRAPFQAREHQGAGQACAEARCQDLCEARLPGGRPVWDRAVRCGGMGL